MLSPQLYLTLPVNSLSMYSFGAFTSQIDTTFACYINYFSCVLVFTSNSISLVSILIISQPIEGVGTQNHPSLSHEYLPYCFRFHIPAGSLTQSILISHYTTSGMHLYDAYSSLLFPPVFV